MLLPPSLQRLTLGELEHVVKLALCCDREVLVYDCDNGRRLKTCFTAVEEEFAGNVAAATPELTLETQLEDCVPHLELQLETFLPQRATAFAATSLATDQSDEAWQQSWMNPGVSFHWI